MWHRRSNSLSRSGGRKRSGARLLGVAAVISATFAAALILPTGTAEAYPFADLNLVGHGWGHGMGMGQWGALGYALDGSSYQQILSHYYGELAAGGNTSIGKLAGSGDSTTVRVAMTEDDGVAPVITSHTAFTVDGVHFAAGQAARLVATSGANTSWNVEIAPGGCSASSWTLTAAKNVLNPTAVPGATETYPVDSNLVNQVLELCEGTTGRGLRGNIEATANSLHQLRTVDSVPLEPYVADVTPSESPADWGTLGIAGPQGERRGFQELEAQAVAVRSYVMSDLGGYGGYADTCDLDCQTYLGITNEDPLATMAATDTASAGRSHARREGRHHAVLVVDRRLDGRRPRSLPSPMPATRSAYLGPATRITRGMPLSPSAPSSRRSRRSGRSNRSRSPAATGTGISVGVCSRCRSSALTGP